MLASGIKMSRYDPARNNVCFVCMELVNTALSKARIPTA